jgi:hypothetical protein
MEPCGDVDELADFAGVEAEETAAVDTLRRALAEAGVACASGEPASQPDAYTLLRFSRARGADTPAAVAMLAATLKWRASSRIDSLLERFAFPEHELVQSAWAHGYHKTDRRGRPVYIDRIGCADLDTLFKVTTPERIAEEHLYEWELLLRERFPACSRAAGRPVRQTMTVVDLAGLSLARFNTARPVVLALTRLDQEYYPEFLGDLILVNAPWVFTAIWAVVSPLLGARTQRKVQVFGDSGYTPRLLEYIDAASLPAFLGGEDTDLCPCGTGPWSDPAFNPKLRTFCVQADDDGGGGGGGGQQHGGGARNAAAHADE